MNFNPQSIKKGEKYIATHKDGRKFNMSLDHVVEKTNSAGEKVPGHIIQYVFKVDQIGDKKGQVWNGFFRATYDPKIAQQEFEHIFSDIKKVE